MVATFKNFYFLIVLIKYIFPYGFYGSDVICFNIQGLKDFAKRDQTLFFIKFDRYFKIYFYSFEQSL